NKNLPFFLIFPGLWARVLSPHEFLLIFFFFFFFFSSDFSRLRYLNNRNSKNWISSDSDLAWSPGACSSCAFNWSTSHITRVKHECILNSHHQITLSGCLFRGIHFTATGPQELSLLFEFRVAICFCNLSHFHSSRFCTAVGLCPFLGFFIPFYITGKAFVSLLPFYIFYDVCVAI
ncbi:unnamed protein product, partial [Penicillium nalgiovense]